MLFFLAEAWGGGCCWHLKNKLGENKAHFALTLPWVIHTRRPSDLEPVRKNFEGPANPRILPAVPCAIPAASLPATEGLTPILQVRRASHRGIISFGSAAQVKADFLWLLCRSQWDEQKARETCPHHLHVNRRGASRHLLSTMAAHPDHPP